MSDETPKQGQLSRRQFLRASGAAVAASTVAGTIMTTKMQSAEAKKSTAPLPQGSVDITLKVNGQSHRLTVQPRVTLLDALRERLQITGAKRICDRGTCGGCTVIKDGKAIYACMMLAVDAQGSEILTVEGMGTPEKMSKVQEKFVEHDALMCGFCTPGFVASCHAALQKNPNATMEEIKRACAGNICRCGTFNRVFEAAVAAAKEMRGA